MVLCVVIFGVGLWVMNSTQMLNSACTLSAKTSGSNACVSGMPFFLLGVGLCTTGVVTMIVAISTLARNMLRSSRRVRSPISTLRPHEVESLRDVA